MIFSSVFFIFTFLPAMLLVYYISPRKFKNFVLLAGSLIFYAWGEPVYIFLMIFSICFNYVCGLDIQRCRGRKTAAVLNLIFAVAVNLFILGFFKYYGFVVENVNGIFGLHIPVEGLALPIGISFYTFQTMSYIIDVYRGVVDAQKNIVDFGLYVSMFPQLIAGPIVKYKDIANQLKERRECFSKFGYGISRFLQGLAKKVLIANTIGSVYQSISNLGLEQLSVLGAWVGILAFTFQIYFDFSGYSDMAIGLGQMFGFEFQENFDHPYEAKGITDFWRRWHISLSTWFREYVYIPLGGNRKGTFRTVRNILIVWLLTGLWHGASWNFVAWGLYYGILLLIEKFVLRKVFDKLPDVFVHVYTMFFVVIGWVLFASPDLGYAGRYLAVMFGQNGAPLTDTAGIYYLLTNAVLFALAAVCSTKAVHRLFQWLMFEGRKGRSKTAVALHILIFVLCIAFLVTETYNPFLYFRF